LSNKFFDVFFIESEAGKSGFNPLLFSIAKKVISDSIISKKSGTFLSSSGGLYEIQNHLLRHVKLQAPRRRSGGGTQKRASCIIRVD
jgi:hypothetical protein